MIEMIFFRIVFVLLFKTRAISGGEECTGGLPCGSASQVPPQSHIGIPRACFNKADPGPCSEDLIRLYYDHKTFTCKWFSYSGCGGNANRFVSVKNCYHLCHPFYRQRFIQLKPPGKGGKEPEEEPEVEDKKDKEKPEEEEKDEGSKSTTEESEEEEKSTTEVTTKTTVTTTEEAEEEEPTGISFFSNKNVAELQKDSGKVFFAKNSDHKEEIKPEVQVVHEYAQGGAPPSVSSMRN